MSRLLNAPLLSEPMPGEVVDETAELRNELAKLRSDFETLRTNLERDRNQLAVLIQSLRSVLNGNQPSAAEASPISNSPLRPPDASVWQVWKERLPPGCSRIIDGLLIQPLTQRQMRVACHMSQPGVSTAVKVLKQNGLLEMDGKLIRLRRL